MIRLKTTKIDSASWKFYIGQILAMFPSWKKQFVKTLRHPAQSFKSNKMPRFLAKGLTFKSVLKADPTDGTIMPKSSAELAALWGKGSLPLNLSQQYTNNLTGWIQDNMFVTVSKSFT